MTNIQHEIDERTNLTNSNKFELLLFRLGADSALGQSELFGINVFKIREIVAMPSITPIVGATPHSLGIVNLRGQVIPVFDLPGIVGCTPKTGLNIMLVTEFARSTQAFAVESVEDIVRLDGNADSPRLAQVLGVEAILQMVAPSSAPPMDEDLNVGPRLNLKAGTIILAADDSFLARSLIERGLKAMHAPYEMTKSGKEAWDRLNAIADAAEAEGKTAMDKVCLVLTDLEMPEMDGFTLTRKIKQDPRLSNIPVVIHSSLSGSANEDHVRSVGANAYVAKFVAEDLAQTIRSVLPH